VTTPYPGTSLYEKTAREDSAGGQTWDHYDHLLSDTMHFSIPGFDISDLNAAKKILIAAQRYPGFKLRCLGRAFLNRTDLGRLVQVIRSNPGILARGLKLFLKSISSRGLELGNPRTKANRIFPK
jgi:hypothetical protein